MSRFVLKEDMFVTGEVWDSNIGIPEDEGYEPYFVSFIMASINGTWRKEKVQVPFVFAHEKCTDKDIVSWFRYVHKHLICEDDIFVGIFSK